MTISTMPMMPEGPYPQRALYLQRGRTASSTRIKAMTRMVLTIGSSQLPAGSASVRSQAQL